VDAAVRMIADESLASGHPFGRSLLLIRLLPQPRRFLLARPKRLGWERCALLPKLDTLIICCF